MKLDIIIHATIDIDDSDVVRQERNLYSKEGQLVASDETSLAEILARIMPEKLTHVDMAEADDFIFHPEDEKS